MFGVKDRIPGGLRSRDIAGLLREARQRRTMGRKIGDPSSRENLVMTSAYERTSVRLSVRTDYGGVQLSGRQPRPPPLQTGINAKILKISPEWRQILIDEFFSISSLNLSFIPPTVSEKIDAKATNIAFSI